MPYDRYRNWDVRLPMELNKLKEQVLRDLAETPEEIDRLEILDSFETAVERAHTADLGEHLADQILFIVRPFLIAAIQGKLPTSSPISRPRAVHKS